MIPKRLKFVRQIRGYSVKGLADHIGVNRSTIYRYESGQIRGHVKTCRAIRKALKVSADYLIGYTDHPFHVLDASDRMKRWLTQMAAEVDDNDCA